MKSAAAITAAGVLILAAGSPGGWTQQGVPSHAQPAPHSAGRKAPPGAQPAPALRIEVAPLGYVPPGAFYLTYRLSSATLHFIDDDHLLFTFRIGGLLRRLPSDRPGDDDQQIRAMVLDARTGKVLCQTEWRMHDRAQYLWPFPDGKFVVRVRDTLYLTDASLVLTPYLTFDTTLREIQVSPDRRTMVIERDDPSKHGPSLEEGDVPAPVNPVKIEVVTAGTRTATVIHDTDSPVNVPIMGDGLLNVLEGGQLGYYAIRDVSFAGQARILAEVKSNCQPSVQPLSARVALVVGCYLEGDDRPVDAISLDGRELWRDSWDNKYVWGWFTYAQNGSRFAYESVEVTHPISAFDELDPTDIAAQLVGVYDTESGKLVLVRDTSPILTAGQNVALSPDGTRFAVLRNGAIELYDLPPVSAPPEAVAKGK
ncbi:MAG TPA: hypothetical protein VMD92_18915 [Acidobacteriaceae bacterium]|nr:hypothetical protein [Acidobacteriaceae bacterium]